MAFLLPALASVAGSVLGKIFHFEEGGVVDAPKGTKVPAVLHGGERVLSVPERKVYDAMMKKAGKPLNQRTGRAVSMSPASVPAPAPAPARAKRSTAGKGTQAMKDRMAKLRAMRKNKSLY